MDCIIFTSKTLNFNN